MPRLTKRLVDAATGTDARDIIWDDDVKGFGLRVSAGGHKVYVFQYRLGGRGAATRRMNIGVHGSPWTPDGARKAAIDLLIAVRRGEDPMAKRREQREEAITQTIEAYVEAFVERYLKTNWPKSWQDGRQLLRHHVVPAWRGRVLRSIGRRDVALLMDSLADRPGMARLVFATLRKMFRWAVERGDLDASPVADMKGPACVPSRDRVLSDDEVAAVWRATDKMGFPFGPIVQLLIATGARREEVAAMRWSELNGDIWVLPAGRSKNGIQHRVPITPLAASILAKVPRGHADLLFTSTGATSPSGFSKAKRKLDELLAADPEAQRPGLFAEPFRLHDLRRTVATGLQRLGIRFEVTEAVLGHVSGAKSGVAGVYQRHDWAAEKREALELWGSHLGNLGVILLPPAYQPLRDALQSSEVA